MIVTYYSVNEKVFYDGDGFREQPDWFILHGWGPKASLTPPPPNGASALANMSGAVVGYAMMVATAMVLMVTTTISPR